MGKTSDFTIDTGNVWDFPSTEAAGHPSPNLEECPRSILDSDTVLYIIKPEVTEGYALDIVCNEEGRGKFIDVDGSPIITGQEGWMFVLRDDRHVWGGKDNFYLRSYEQRFHHSSFFGGKDVPAAGIIVTDENGYLTTSRLYPHSEHYRAGESHMQRLLFFLPGKALI